MAKRHLPKWHVIYKKIKKTKVNTNVQSYWHPPPPVLPYCVNESNWPSCAIGKVRTCRRHFSMRVLTWIMTSHLKLPPPLPPLPNPLKEQRLFQNPANQEGQTCWLAPHCSISIMNGTAFRPKKWGLKRFLNN